MKCAFCDLPEIQKRTITKNKYAWAFPSNMPITPGHTLICPVRHVAKFNDLAQKEIIEVLKLTEKIKSALKKTFKASGFNYAWNEEKIAGQSVPHFHLHVVPRTKNDSGIYHYEPRRFLYRPGVRETSPEKESLSISKLIKKNLT